jgi:hypothetical protein
LLVKHWKESNLRTSIAGKTVEREQTYVKALLVRQRKENNLRKGIAGKTVEREQPT